jgi:Ribosome biogenesis protein SLX9
LPSSSSSATPFSTTKKDKRLIKHSHLLSKVKKSSTSSEAQRNKRRRQKKQLVANLESLADALPQDVDIATSGREGQRSRGTVLRKQADVILIGRKSMKSRPGALKRRERVDKGERTRFTKNLAELTGRGIGEQKARSENKNSDAQSCQQAHNSWAALRGFIAQTLEQRPETRELKS